MNYFIKSEYVHKDTVESVEVAPGDYWTDQRIEMSGLYQYHVYEQAHKFFQKNNIYKSILDIGSGPGTKSSSFFSNEPKCEVTLVDQKTVKSIAKKVFPGAKFINADLDAIYTFDNTYDLIICADVIEHLLYPEKLLTSIRSAMHKGSTLFISTPERDILRGLDNIQSSHKEHVREWNKKEFVMFLESEGFSVEKSFLLPQSKVSKSTYLYSRFSSLFHKIPHYHANQTHLCKLK